MASNRDVLIIDQSALEKLPSDYLPLLDPDTPLPSNVEFFEVEKTWKDVIMALVVGVILIIIGLALAAAYLSLKRSDSGVTVSNSDTWGFLLVGAFIGVSAGMFFIFSIRNKIKIITAQRAGHSLRFGLFLLPEALLIREEVSFSLLGRNRIQRLEKDAQGRTIIFYQPEGATTTPQKTLPERLRNMDLPALWERVQVWWKT